MFSIEYPQNLIERFVCHSGRPLLVDQTPIKILPEDFVRLPDQVQPPLGLMLMDELKVAVHVPLDKVDFQEVL